MSKRVKNNSAKPNLSHYTDAVAVPGPIPRTHAHSPSPGVSTSCMYYSMNRHTEHIATPSALPRLGRPLLQWPRESTWSSNDWFQTLFPVPFSSTHGFTINLPDLLSNLKLCNGMNSQPYAVWASWWSRLQALTGILFVKALPTYYKFCLWCVWYYASLFMFIKLQVFSIFSCCCDIFEVPFLLQSSLVWNSVLSNTWQILEGSVAPCSYILYYASKAVIL